jgi:hypothetical protein
MNSIYDALINRARSPYAEPPPLTDLERKTIREIMESILRLAAQLRAEGLLVSEVECFDDPRFVEYRWKMPESKCLVARGFGPAGPGLLGFARVAVGVADEASPFVEVTACGFYTKPWHEEESLGIHAAILGGFADLVARYRTGSSC